VEALESRIVPYALSGGAWPSPQLITISFVPDGTVVGVYSNGPANSTLFQTFNREIGPPAVWQGIIEKAAETWAAVANVNFTIVGDNGTPIGQGPDQQGDPNMGDIRVGAYNFGYNWLSQAVYPPPVNNYSAAGDIQFNTAYPWHNGCTYDLLTAAIHEMGHALGLGESAIRSAVMYATYTGVKTSLTADDVQGIQAIYGARPTDAYNSGGLSDQTQTTAANLTSLIDPTTLTAVAPNLDLTSTSETEWYTFTAPQNTSGTLTATVQSSGLSLFTPQATLYAADGSTVLATANGAGSLNGSTLTLSAANVTPGEQFYVKVTGADRSVFSLGTYGLTLNFGTGPSPTVPPPTTTLANGNPLQAGGGSAELPASIAAGNSNGSGSGGRVAGPALTQPGSQTLVSPVFVGAGVPATGAGVAALPFNPVPPGGSTPAGLAAPAGQVPVQLPRPALQGDVVSSLFAQGFPAGSLPPAPGMAEAGPAFVIRADAAAPLRGPYRVGQDAAAGPRAASPAGDLPALPLPKIEGDRGVVPSPTGTDEGAQGRRPAVTWPDLAAAVFALCEDADELPGASAGPSLPTEAEVELPAGRLDFAVAAGLLFGAAARPGDPEGVYGRKKPSRRGVS
jgi:hypothetical protein